MVIHMGQPIILCPDKTPLTWGTKVTFGQNFEFCGEITGIILRQESNEYEITSWKDRELQCIWLKEKYIRIIGNEGMRKVGFINDETSK